MKKINVIKQGSTATCGLPKKGFIVAACFCTFFYPQEIYAASLRDLAVEFLNRINPVYEEKKPFNALDQIPEGGTLLLRPRSEKIFFGSDIYAVKNNNQVFISLYDFINILEFPIEYDETELEGAGWFLREDWNIDIDLNDRTIKSRGKNIAVQDDEVIEREGDYFVNKASLEKWFGLLINIDVQQQVMDIESPFPFPAIAKAKRDKKLKGRREKNKPVAVLPRLEQEKSLFDINTADVSIGNRIQKRQNGDATHAQTASVNMQGEILKHNASIFASGDDTNQIRNIRGELFRRSEDAELLGPLGARFYTLGDITETRLPIVSDADRNVGFRFTNSSLENTDFATTDIEGRLFPGWDVELYRNGILIDTQTVEADGEYLFDEVQLFAGDNDFELFFFGPQGEIRSQNVSVPVSQALLSSQDNTYEFSVALEDTQTYRDTHIDDEDTNTANITARYNKLIGDNHLAYMGFRTRQIDGDRKYFVTAGATSTLGATLLDTNFVVDQDGEGSAQALFRRNLMGWSTSMRARLNTDDFQTAQTALNTSYELAFNAQKAITFGGFKNSFLVNSLYREAVDGSEFKSFSVAVANRLLGASISNRLRYEDRSLASSGNFGVTDGDDLNHILSIRKNFGRFFLNFGSTYSLKPESELEVLRAGLNYRYGNKYSADLSLERRFATDLDTARLNFNYLNDKYRLSPFIEYNSDNEILAGINLNFSMYDDPNSPWPEFTSSRLSNRGAVSAFVYHDKNGNNMFDEGDEPLSDAAIQSLPSTRRADTDEDGYATIYDLPIYRATDISIRENGLADPFMVPATKGNSVYPVEGTIYNMEFPVHMTGEVDGTVYRYDPEEEKNEPVSFQTVKLVPVDNADQDPITVKAERDGFYVAYMIPPGRYLLMTDKDNKYGNLPPQILTIGPDGPILKDIGIELVKDAAYVPYDVADMTEISDYSRMLQIKQGGKSELSETLYDMINKKTQNLYKNLMKVAEQSKDDGTYAYYIALNPTDMNSQNFLHDTCAAMRDALVECSIVINRTAIDE